jgi:hypothetical protein
VQAKVGLLNELRASVGKPTNARTELLHLRVPATSRLLPRLEVCPASSNRIAASNGSRSWNLSREDGARTIHDAGLTTTSGGVILIAHVLRK